MLISSDHNRSDYEKNGQRRSNGERSGNLPEPSIPADIDQVHRPNDFYISFGVVLQFQHLRQFSRSRDELLRLGRVGYFQFHAGFFFT